MSPSVVAVAGLPVSGAMGWAGIAVEVPRSAAWMRFLLGGSGAAALGLVAYALVAGDTSLLNRGLIAAPFFLLGGGTQLVRRNKDGVAPSRRRDPGLPSRGPVTLRVVGGSAWWPWPRFRADHRAPVAGDRRDQLRAGP